MTRREGDYDVTDTQHYLVRRAGSVTFEKIPVDASSKMPDENMDSIEPSTIRPSSPSPTRICRASWPINTT